MIWASQLSWGYHRIGNVILTYLLNNDFLIWSIKKAELFMTEVMFSGTVRLVEISGLTRK